jgi:hypothetical protein
MSSETKKAADTESKTEDGKGKSNQGVVDYLQAPRKKRRSFVVIASNGQTDPETIQALVKFVKVAYPKFSVATPKSAEEFVRQFSRNINLVVIEDTFIGLSDTLELIKTMKQKKNESPIPTLFLTKDPDTLVKAYSETLALWNEIDEYVVPALTPRPYLYAKVKTGIDERFRRRSRRYKMNFPIVYTNINHGERRFKGQVVDLSVHGAQITSSEGELFTPKDQLVVHLPYSQFVKDGATDVIRMSAKVRRIFISGDRAGISWEYLSDGKLELVSRMLTKLVDASLGRQAAMTRAKIAKQEADEIAATQRALPKEKSKDKDKDKEKEKQKSGEGEKLKAKS